MLDSTYRQFEKTSFNKQYYLLEVLGSTTFGAVFRSKAILGNNQVRSVALKAIRGDRGIPLNRIFRELQKSTVLNHPHLLHCYTTEVGELSNPSNPNIARIECRGLVMEIADSTLADYWEYAGRSLHPDKVKTIVCDIASALVYLHNYCDEQGNTIPIIYQGLNLNNILRVGQIFKLGDVCITRSLASKSVAYTAPELNLAYSPPEVMNSQSAVISTAWDIWSLGVVMVELLTGQHPFPATNDTQMLQKVLTETPQIASSVPKHFRKIIQQCLIKDWQNRCTAQAILDVLNPRPLTLPIGMQSLLSKTISRRVSAPVVDNLRVSRRWMLLAGSSFIGIVSCRNQRLTPLPTPAEPSSKTLLERVPEITLTSQTALELASNRNSNYIESLSSSVGLEMIYIPAGRFLMGSHRSETGAFQNEFPQHQVYVPNFYIGKYEITQTQYQAVMGTNPSFYQGANRPVNNIFWVDAELFCQKLSQKTGKTYRLPTEAEWEYACRAGSTTRYYFGNNEDLAGNYGWYKINSGGQPQPVGQKHPNQFGLYDMYGNVWEFCADDWHSNYEDKPEALKQDGSITWLSRNPDWKVIRGGAWNNDTDICYSARRASELRDELRDDSLPAIGIRVVCSFSKTS